MVGVLKVGVLMVGFSSACFYLFVIIYGIFFLKRKKNEKGK